jgi:hypothetical protein
VQFLCALRLLGVDRWRPWPPASESLAGSDNAARLFKSDVILDVAQPRVYKSIVEYLRLDFLLVMENITLRGGSARCHATLDRRTIRLAVWQFIERVIGRIGHRRWMRRVDPLALLER